MTDADRSMLLQLLEDTGASFESALRSVPPDRWLTPSVSGSWSPAQITEHVVLTERSLLVLIRRKLIQTPPAESTEAQRAIDKVLLERISRRDGGTQRVEAPEWVRPSKGYGSAEVGLQTFAVARTASIEFVKTTEVDLRVHRLPHPAAGELDGVQWLIFLAAHCERHVRQMEHAAAAAG